NYTASRDIAFKCVGGKAVMISSNFSYSWTYDAIEGLYKATLNGTSTAVGAVDMQDRTDDGDPLILFRQDNLAALKSSDYGSWFDSSTRTMWVKRRLLDAPTFDTVIPYRVEVLGVEA